MAGQFIILRVDEDSERVPFTVYASDPERGSVSIIFQVVGATTNMLDQKRTVKYISDFAGPLGIATNTVGKQRVCIIGGGVGCAIALPISRAFKEHGTHVTNIIGFCNRDLIILKDVFKTCSDVLHIMTDDGSYGEHANVCMPLVKMLGGSGIHLSSQISAISPTVILLPGIL